jgi:hypothetical protein
VTTHEKLEEIVRHAGMEAQELRRRAATEGETSLYMAAEIAELRQTLAVVALHLKVYR